METNQHNVIQQQHNRCELVCDLALAKGVVAKVADILDLGVLHDEFVHGHRSDVEEHTSYYHGDDAGNPPEDTCTVSYGKKSQREG